MTSVLNVDTIADKAGTGPVGLTKQHAAKCWMNYNQNTPAIDDSFGISSVADNATGDFIPSYSNSFVNVDYAMAGMACNTIFISMEDNNAQTDRTTASSTRLLAMNYSGTQSDQEQTMVTWHGDLA